MNINKLLKPIADKSTFLYNSFLSTISNPNKLSASYGDREVTLENIQDDPHVTATIQSRKAGVLSLEYNIVLNDSNMQYKELFEHIVDTINLHRFVDSALDAVFFGYQVMEVSWRYERFNEQTFLLPYAITEKPRSWFGFNSNNMLVLNNYSNEPLPAYKFVLIQHKPTYLNPYGEAVLSKCLWPIVFKKSAFTFWAMLCEKMGIPHLIGKTDSVYGTDAYNAFLDSLDQLIQDGSMVVSTLDQIEVINPTSPQNIDVFNKLIETANTEISKAILSQTLTTDVGDTGSYAAAQTHLEVKKEIEDSDKDLVEDALNKLFEWVAKFNLPPGIDVPYITLFRPSSANNELATFVDTLTKNNQIRFTKEFYINKFGFNDTEFELVEQPAAPQLPFAEADNETNDNTTPINFESKNTIPWDQVLIDNFGDRMLKESNEFNPVLDIVMNFINEQTDLQSAIDGLADLLPKMDNKELEDKLTNIMFLASVVGQLSIDGENKL